MKISALIASVGLSVAVMSSTVHIQSMKPLNNIEMGKLSYEYDLSVWQQMLSLPRRSPAVPNAQGTKALFASSAYDFNAHQRTSGIYYVDLEKNNTHVITEGPGNSDQVWLNDDEVIFLKNGDTGDTEIHIADLSGSEVKLSSPGRFTGPVSALEVRLVSSTEVKFLVSGMATPEDKLYNENTAPKKHSTARVYDSIFVRHWDTWITENRNTIFSGTFVRSSDDDDEWSISGDIVNVIPRKHNLESPIPLFGGTDHFDLSPDGKSVAFVAKDPELVPALYTTSWLYIAPFDGSAAPRKISAPDYKGASGNPKWSPDGKKVAWIQMKHEAYESDQNRIFVVDIEKDSVTAILNDWFLSAASLKWASKSDALDITAEVSGRVSLFSSPLIEKYSTEVKRITNEYSVTDYYRTGDNSFFVSATSLTSPEFYVKLNDGKVTWVSNAPTSREAMLSSAAATEAEYATVNGLSRSQVSDFKYRAGKDDNHYDIHGWMVKPSYFDENTKYPLAFLIHGGPQGAWDDTWSTRWNPAVYAEAGYIAVAINPTGSTGYGQNLTDAIRNNWGAGPYEDLVKGYEYLLDEYKFIDEERTVALGASYGGYMVNWIQGNPLGRKFKALVCHDGIFNTENQYSTEELWFPNHDFGGSFVDVPENYKKYNPADLVHNWATPQFTIHNTLDYRIPESEGLTVFNILQTKGVPSKFLSFPDENHWVLKPENSKVWHEEVFRFINHYVGL